VGDDLSSSTQTSAAAALRLDAAARDALLGYANLELVVEDQSIIFGTWNQRPLKMSEMKKIKMSMEEHGVRRRDHQNFLTLIIPREQIECTLAKDPYASSGLPALKVKSTGGVVKILAAAGQHRFAAVMAI
jgi:hypothetical protein